MRPRGWGPRHGISVLTREAARALAPPSTQGPSKARKQASPRTKRQHLPLRRPASRTGSNKAGCESRPCLQYFVTATNSCFPVIEAGSFLAHPLPCTLFICSAVRLIGFCLCFFGVLPPFLLIDLRETLTWF